MNFLSSLISVEWLFDHLNEPNLIIVDCRFQLSDSEQGYEQYRLNHIPHAVYLHLDQDLSASLSQHGGRHPLPSVDQLTQVFNRIGLHADSFVVAYDHSRFAFAARLWWLLRYCGHQKVALLDGGWSAWQKEGYPVTKEIYQPKLGNFKPEIQENWVVDIETVKRRKDLSSVVLVDARESDRYLGKREPLDPVAGAIEGAINVPWLQITTDQGLLKPLEFQKNLWKNYKNAEEIIVYCGSGVTACVDLFSLHLIGFNNPRLYGGGWSDWCSYLR